MSTWEAPSLPSQLAADPRTCASGHRDPQGPAGTTGTHWDSGPEAPPTQTRWGAGSTGQWPLTRQTAP